MKHILTILFCASILSATAQPAERRQSRESYISTWSKEAQHQMMLHGIPASITLAQGILESANGNSALAKYANNHFGIKCHTWNGATFTQDDDKRNECFRKYPSAAQSFEDHSAFLTTRSRYDFLFSYKPTDYKKWAHGLRKAGYATNPKYGYLLIKIIEQHQLDKYDKIDMKTLKKQPKIIEREDLLVIETKNRVKIKDNGLTYLVAHSGDTFYKLAKNNGLSLSQIYKYNDLGKNAMLHIGDIVYLERKKNRSKISEHTVTASDTMWRIAQTYGVKIKKLYKKNGLIIGQEPTTGSVLKLK